jgi:hypothetical protein
MSGHGDRAVVMVGDVPGNGDPLVSDLQVRPGGAVVDRPLQQTATEDIGHFAAEAFGNRDTWAGRAIGLASDELAMTQTAQVFSALEQYLIRHGWSRAAPDPADFRLTCCQIARGTTPGPASPPSHDPRPVSSYW